MLQILCKIAHSRLPSVGFRRPELIPVLGSHPAGDVNHKPDGSLPLLSAGPAVTLTTLTKAATSFAAWWTEARWVWRVCLRLLPDSVATAIWTQALLRLSPAANHSATEPPHKIPIYVALRYSLQISSVLLYGKMTTFRGINWSYFFAITLRHMRLFVIFTARCYASAVLAMGLCLSVCVCLWYTQLNVVGLFMTLETMGADSIASSLSAHCLSRIASD